jgi:hypothetical protein
MLLAGARDLAVAVMGDPDTADVQKLNNDNRKLKNCLRDLHKGTAAKEEGHQNILKQFKPLVAQVTKVNDKVGNDITRLTARPIQEDTDTVKNCTGLKTWQSGLDAKRCTVAQMWNAANGKVIGDDQAKLFGEVIDRMAPNLTKLMDRCDEWGTIEEFQVVKKKGEAALKDVRIAAANGMIIEALHLKTSKADLVKIRKNVSKQPLDCEKDLFAKAHLCVPRRPARWVLILVVLLADPPPPLPGLIQ